MKIQLTSKKVVYPFSEPYIIAEIGANHNGDMELARKMIDEAKECGADCVKFQSWTPESLIAKEEYDRNQSYDDSPKKHFGSLREMVEKYFLRDEQHLELKGYCDTLNIDFCSTPFSEKEADLLQDMHVPFFKVASMDINNLRLLKHIARKKKPMVLSTGMASLSEIEQAVTTIENEGNSQIILLHCISIYPPDYKDIHLNNIPMLQQTFQYPVGFSDHTMGTAIPLASIALGAAIIEKHFTLDKDLPGWDHEISADPTELKEIVNQTKNIYKALGYYRRTVSIAEQEKKLKFRRSIVTAKVMKQGDVINKEDIVFKRPGNAIAPDNEHLIVGRKLNRNLGKDEIIHWEDLM